MLDIVFCCCAFVAFAGLAALVGIASAAPRSLNRRIEWDEPVEDAPLIAECLDGA